MNEMPTFKYIKIAMPRLRYCAYTFVEKSNKILDKCKSNHNRGCT